MTAMLRLAIKILGPWFLATILVVACCGQNNVTSSNSINRSADLNRALSWFPTEIETLLVSNGPFRISTVLNRHNESKNIRETTEELNKEFERWTLPLFYAKDGLLEKHLEGKIVLLSVEGSRHFRSPNGLGEMPFDGCEIAIFEDDVSDVRDAFMKDTASVALRVQEIEGQKVTVFEESSEQDILTTFVTFPQKNVVLVATDEQFLRQTLIRMRDTNAKGGRALPDSLPEWKNVDTGKRFWGLRHYDRKQAKEDPSSPFGGRKSANIPDENAIGLTFDFEPGKTNVARITYLSGPNTDLNKIEEKRFPLDADEAIPGLHIHRAALGPGVMQTTYDLNYSQQVSIFLFVLLGNMGHGIYL